MLFFEDDSFYLRILKQNILWLQIWVISDWKISPQESNFLSLLECSFFPWQVTCITCNYKSNTVEPFWDLSLEFPERYHSINKGIVPLNQTECMLTEMLAKFTETEALEGRIYACDQCNSKKNMFCYVFSLNLLRNVLVCFYNYKAQVFPKKVFPDVWHVKSWNFHSMQLYVLLDGNLAR